ncbi:MAG: polysaccharide biosynthesis tyrosine autokinase [Pseudomonadota bacterium]|nr:polysaccharide biosynthesis tyrosine autokinase [Pseudomonadota bacterium]
MDTPSEQHAVSSVVHQTTTPDLQWETRTPEMAAGAHGRDPKGYLNTLYDSRWLIGAITALVTAAAGLYALAAKPVYEANLMIHVEEDSPNASKNILSEASSLYETKQAAIAEMELMRSRMVVARAVDKLHLFIEAQPKYFPIIGRRVAGAASDALSEPGIFGWGGYAWGGEAIDVAVFNVPAAWQNREFTLTALAGQRYRFDGGGGAPAFDGAVGQRYLVPVDGGGIELKVERMEALAGAQFLLKRASRLGTIERIQSALVIAERGKLSGVVEVKLQGDSAKRSNQMLSEIAREYMRQNLARKTEEAEKSLAFLNQQLPILKRQLEQSEDKYNQFRNAHGSIDLREEARMSLLRAGDARTRRLELIQKKTALLTRFTEEHPIVKGINAQLAEADTEIAAVAERIRTLPVLEQDESRLTREIKVNTDLYMALATTAQQLRLISVGRVSNVRMIDAPMAPEAPVKPNRPLIVALAGMVGLLLGGAVALARKALAGGIDSPQQIERLLGAAVVYATIPHSANQEQRMKRARRDGPASPLLAQAIPEDAAIESLRSFRATLQFSMRHFRNNIVMLVGPTANVGKSFVSANFAAVMAAAGKRVLLIDADVRNGHLHRYFGLRRDQGLSMAISGAVPVEQVIHRGVLENLDFIATGTLPQNRAEFLLNLNFGVLLETVSAQYDLVLLDAPPVLAVADALVIGAHAGAVFILTRAGVTTAGEIHESIKRLNHAGISPQGVLFNDMAPRLDNDSSLYRFEPVPALAYSS